MLNNKINLLDKHVTILASGPSVENYLDSNKKFIAQINNNQVVELRGSKEDYYSKYLNNIII